MSVDAYFDLALLGALALLIAALVFAGLPWLLGRLGIPRPWDPDSATKVKVLSLLVATSVVFLVVAGSLSRADNTPSGDSEFASSDQNVSAASLETPLPESTQGGSNEGASVQVESEDSPADVAPALTVTPQTGPTIEATPIPTVTPLPDPTVEVALVPTPTITPEPEPTAAGPQLDPASIVNRTVAAEADVQSGRFDATIDFGPGRQSTSTILFDLSLDQEQPPQLRYTNTYESSEASQTTDFITVGDRTWSLQPDGSWLEMAEEEGVWGRVQAFLPNTSSATDVAVDLTGATAELRWHDSVRDADVVLTVDAATGTPLELERIGTTNGVVVNVVYWAWNVPVEIEPPDGS